MIFYTARRTDNDFYTAAERPKLIAHASAAINRSDARKFARMKRVNFLAYLKCKLACRCKNKRTNFAFVFFDCLYKRNAERGGFSCAGSGFCDNVGISVQKARYCKHLNRRRLFKTLCSNSGKSFLSKTEVFKRDSFFHVQSFSTLLYIAQFMNRKSSRASLSSPSVTGKKTNDAQHLCFAILRHDYKIQPFHADLSADSRDFIL